MRIVLSQKLRDDLSHSVHSAYAAQGIVNVPVLAEQIRSRNAAENVALEDIATCVVAHAQLLSAAMEFDGQD
jgi:hypothetical protein